MVRRFFSSETGIWRFFGWVGDIVMLSLLWTMCSLPLVTAGAASTALYDAAVHVMRRKDDSLFSRFFGTFRRELKSACLTTLFWAAVAAVPLFFYSLIVRHAPEAQPVTAQSVLLLLLLYLLLCVLCWVFPLLSRFTFDFVGLNRTGIRIALGNILRSASMALLCGGAVALFSQNVSTVFFSPGLVAWLSSFLIEPVFERYSDHS